MVFSPVSFSTNLMPPKRVVSTSSLLIERGNQRTGVGKKGGKKKRRRKVDGMGDRGKRGELPWKNFKIPLPIERSRKPERDGETKLKERREK